MEIMLLSLLFWVLSFIFLLYLLFLLLSDIELTFLKQIQKSTDFQFRDDLFQKLHFIVRVIVPRLLN